MSKMYSVGEAEGLVKQFIAEEEDESLHSFMEQLLRQEKLPGSQDEFHNFAVNFAQKDDYETACKILDVGIQQYPRSVDLLADYIKYGIYSDRLAKCKTHYNTLISIPKRRWTWRGFDFAIDYLLRLAEEALTDEELELQRATMLDIAHDFRSILPHDEQSYISEAEIYSFFNEHAAEESLLKEALEKLSMCPKCALRYADLLFDQGRMDEIQPIIKRVLRDSIRTQQSINEGYAYYLSALCQVIDIQDSESFNDAETIKSTYKDFQIAKLALPRNSSYSRTIDKQIKILEIKTGIDFDSIDEE